MNKKLLKDCLNCPRQWKWGGPFFIIVYIFVGTFFGTSIVMDFLHSKKKKNNALNNITEEKSISNSSTKEEKLSSLFIFLGFLFLFLYQYLNKSKSGLVIVFPLIIISGYVFIFRLINN